MTCKPRDPGLVRQFISPEREHRVGCEVQLSELSEQGVNEGSRVVESFRESGRPKLGHRGKKERERNPYGSSEGACIFRRALRAF